MNNPQILHVDMDQFYAAVEIRDDPRLAGRPVVIGSDPKQGRGRGVVSTASYEARKFGVHSALPISMAWKRCPQAVFLPVHMSKYIAESKIINDIFESVTPLVEPISLDEAFLDVTDSHLLFGDGIACAKHIRREIFLKTSLTASVGIAPNKFLAKIASDINKPDGLCVVEQGKEKEFLAPLKVGTMWGVGPKAGEKLARLGIYTIGDLQKWPLSSLQAELGSHAIHLKELAEGMDFRDVEPEYDSKSIGREYTFAQDTSSLALLRQTLAELSEDVAWRLRRHGLQAGRLTLKIRFTGFETHTRQRPLRPFTNHGPDLYRPALEMTRDFLKKKRKKVRLIGLSTSRLQTPGSEVQPELFGDATKKNEKIDSVMDALKEKYGDDAVRRGRQLAIHHRPGS